MWGYDVGKGERRLGESEFCGSFIRVQVSESETNSPRSHPVFHLPPGNRNFRGLRAQSNRTHLEVHRASRVGRRCRRADSKDTFFQENQAHSRNYSGSLCVLWFSSFLGRSKQSEARRVRSKVDVHTRRKTGVLGCTLRVDPHDRITRILLPFFQRNFTSTTVHKVC